MALHDPKCDNCGRSNPTVRKRAVIDAPTLSGKFWKVVEVVWCDHCWLGVVTSFGRAVNLD